MLHALAQFNGGTLHRCGVRSAHSRPQGPGMLQLAFFALRGGHDTSLRLEVHQVAHSHLHSRRYIHHKQHVSSLPCIRNHTLHTRARGKLNYFQSIGWSSQLRVLYPCIARERHDKDYDASRMAASHAACSCSSLDIGRLKPSPSDAVLFHS